MKIDESLKEFYEANHLDERWMGRAMAGKGLKLWPTRLIPRSLRDWVKVHDVHHLIRSYDTDLDGEAEIAAWALPRNGLKFWGELMGTSFFNSGRLNRSSTNWADTNAEEKPQGL